VQDSYLVNLVTALRLKIHMVKTTGGVGGGTRDFAEILGYKFFGQNPMKGTLYLVLLLLHFLFAIFFEK
jgi:hypothetical protein